MPIEPSVFGLPTSWHFMAAARHGRPAPRIAVIDIGGRSTAPLWNFSEKAICSVVKSPVPGHRRPGRRRVAAPQELLVLGRVALLAVGRRELLRDREPAVVERLLALGRLVAVQAVDPGRVVLAHLVLVDHRRGLAAVALGALAGRAHQGRGRLVHLRRGAVAC